jgi:signal transduction histidine kinase
MTLRLYPGSIQTRPNRGIILALYLFYLAGVGRTLAAGLTGAYPSSRLGWILGLEVVFILICTLALWRPPLHRSWLYFYFLLQSALIVAMIALNSNWDFVTGFFLLIAYQIAWLISGWQRWVWVIGIGVLGIGPLILWLGLLRGLALGLVATTGVFVLTAYVIAQQDVEMARARSQAVLLELQANQEQLKEYASQVEELAAIEERSQLARDLHDSVSQTLFSIQLSTRSAQLLLEKDPSRVRAQLVVLQELVQTALAEMRKLITDMRIQGD